MCQPGSKLVQLALGAHVDRVQEHVKRLGRRWITLQQREQVVLLVLLVSRVLPLLLRVSVE